MDGNKSNRTGVQLDELTAFLRNPHRFAQNRLRCRCAHANHDLRPHDLDLSFQPRPTRHHLSDRGLLMKPPLDAPYPFDMLDRVSDVNMLVRDSRLSKRLINQTSRGSDEGTALSILLIPGLLPDKHYICSCRPFAEDCLSSVLV